MNEKKCPVCNDPLWFFHGVGEDDCSCAKDHRIIRWRECFTEFSEFIEEDDKNGS